MPREAPPPWVRAERYSESREGDGGVQHFPEAKPRQPATRAVGAAKPKKPLPRETLAGIADGRDRIVLGAALNDLPPPAAGDPLAPANEIGERLLKMETTLHLLNQEVDKLSSAAALGAESRAIQDKIQDLQAQQSVPGVLPSAQAAMQQAPIKSSSNTSGWTELLLGLLLGGSVSAGVAHLVSRRQDKARMNHTLARQIAKPAERRRPITG